MWLTNQWKQQEQLKEDINMAKRRLTEIAQELGISFDEARERVFKYLSEEMISGKGKNTWVSDDGQVLLDDCVPMPVIYRGPILSSAPNPLYVMVKIRELGKKVPVRIPARLQRVLTIGKMIYVQCVTEEEQQKFTYIKSPKV